MMQLDQERLPMWTVYDRPLDHPDHFVARLWLTFPRMEATKNFVIGDSLEDIHAKVQAATPFVLNWIPRCDDDDPVIVGTWF